MGKFQITLVRPQGFIHSEAFREVAETLQFGLRSIGHTAQAGHNVVDSAATNILLGAHLLPRVDAHIVPPGSILYNLEQIGGANLSPAYYELASRHQVWDYSPRNIEKWKAMKCFRPPIQVPLGYVPELSRIQASPTQDIDVLFYGSLNERRTAILKALRDSGVKVHTAFGVYGKERDELIARSKIVLNIHFYDTKVFEIVRLSYLLANSKAVVSECSSESELEQSANGSFLAVPYNSLVESCLSLLRNEQERRRLEIRGFEWFSQQRESEILSRALNQCTVPAAACAEPVAIPRKLNLGSGKDWRPDCFNADFDPYWEPDAVLDFNHPLPIGKPLETPRLGTVVLENNFFDEIIARDALEHIPNLTTAMTSCLNLLKVGGLFRISVPYDLSWGAWQDPTHVRAFNERSWLYYTDWFWYMGWTEARFDLVQFDLGLSPIGEALKQQQVKGEDLVRHPRAIDQLRVILRKRLLTDAEKQQVATYLKRPNRRAAAASQSGPTAGFKRVPSPAPPQPASPHASAANTARTSLPAQNSPRHQEDSDKQFNVPFPNSSAIPVLIPCFNNPTYLRNTIRQLHDLSFRNIIVVDNASTYPPMKEYLASLKDGVAVVNRTENLGPHLFLDDKIYGSLPQYFVITDPDLEFNPRLPSNFLEELIRLTEKHEVGKAGFALGLADRDQMHQQDFDLPMGKYKIWEWESLFWLPQVDELDGGDPVYRAVVDTTFAVYNKNYFRTENHVNALRVAGRYSCRHLPWYRTSIVPPAEYEAYACTAPWSYYKEAQAPVIDKAPIVSAQAQAHVTQIAGVTGSPLIVHLQAAFNKAMAGTGQMDPAVLEMDGMSGRKYRLLINNLIANLPNARYLEIGTWSGSTLCSAINGNSVRATAIDNWSEFGGPKAQFLRNLERFKTPGSEVSFIEKDFRSVDYVSLGRFNVYMFDGPHNAADQFAGISLVLPALEDEFILIVDDWNHTPARQGTLKALHDLKLSVLHSFEIRTTFDGSHATLARQASDWHNGYFIAVVSKPKAPQALSRVHDLQAQAVPV